MKVRGQSQLGHQAPRHVQKAKVRKKEVAQMQTSHKTGHRAIDGRPPVVRRHLKDSQVTFCMPCCAMLA